MKNKKGALKNAIRLEMKQCEDVEAYRSKRSRDMLRDGDRARRRVDGGAELWRRAARDGGERGSAQAECSLRSPGGCTEEDGEGNQ